MTTAPVLEGPYFHDLMDQPRALQATLGHLAEDDTWETVQRLLYSRPWHRIVLTGMGSSFHSLHPLALAFVTAGYAPVMMETAQLVHYGQPLCGVNTLVVLLSQSGRSAETLRLLEDHRHATVLGITNSPDSPLAQGADLALLTQAGPEFSVSCKTYVVGMLVLQWLGGMLAGRHEGETLSRLAPIATLVSEYLGQWRAHVDALVQLLSGTRHLFLAGRGRSLAAVGTGALIVKEASRVHAEGMSSAAFRHGPLEMLRGDIATMVFDGDEPTRALNRRLVDELAAGGFICEQVGAGARLEPLRLPVADSELLPILEILPVEMMTLALAVLAGREAGKFERASKVTATE